MFALPRKTQGATLLTLLAMLAATSTSMQAQDNDLTPNCNWQPVKIGAGGWMRGLVIGDSTLIYARAHVDGLYRWDSANGVWHQTKVISPPYGMTGPFPGTTGIASPSFAIASAPTTSGAGAIGVDPSNGNNVLVAYDINYSADPNLTNVKLNVYYSTDGGVTFPPSNMALPSIQSRTTPEIFSTSPPQRQRASIPTATYIWALAETAPSAQPIPAILPMIQEIA